VVRIHDGAVVAVHGLAIDQQVAAAMRAQMVERYRLEHVSPLRAAIILLVLLNRASERLLTLLH